MNTFSWTKVWTEFPSKKNGKIKEYTDKSRKTNRTKFMDENFVQRYRVSSNNVKSIDIHECSLFGQRNNFTDFCRKLNLK